jgi:hypothetical protein
VTEQISRMMKMILMTIEKSMIPNRGDIRRISERVSSYCVLMVHRSAIVVKIHHGSLHRASLETRTIC